MHWSILPHTEVCVCLQATPFLVFLCPHGQKTNSQAKIGRVTSTTVEFLDHIGFQIAGDWRFKGRKSGFQFLGTHFPSIAVY